MSSSLTTTIYPDDGFETALRCRALTCRYGDVKAVDGLDLEVYMGECFGLLGPNGAGKTTTVEIFEGLIEPHSGTVEVLGSRWGTGHDQMMCSRIGVQLQEARFGEKLTVEETIKLFRSFYRSGFEVEQVLHMVELQEKRRAQVGKLSGGQRQRLAIACAIAGDPDLLFLDEPTTGLDPQARLKLWDIIEQFRASGGSILLTTHYMEEAARLCDRVAIIDRGRVIAIGAPAELIASLGAEQIVEFSVKHRVADELLAALPGVRSLHSANGKYALTISDIGLALPALLAEIKRQQAELVTLTTHQATLEDVFVNLTGRMLRDG